MKTLALYYQLFTLCVLTLITASCNTDNDIIPGNKPTIEFDSPDGVYTVKVGHDLRIDPIVGHGDGAAFLWTSNGETVSTSRALVMNFPRLGSYYVMLTVTTPAGSTSAEARVDVVETTPPIIDLALPTDGVYLLPGQEYLFEPRFQHDDVDGFRAVWNVNGTDVAEGKTYTFRRATVGDYQVAIHASNEDGETTETFTVHVVESLPRSLSFPAPSVMQTSTTRYTFPNRPVILTPDAVNIASDAAYSWKVNGKNVDETGSSFKFTPTAAGTYTVTVSADGVTATVDVVCVDATEQSRMRPATASSSAYINKVWEYVPAPGQFIGDTSTEIDMPDGVNTLQDALRWAELRLSKRQFVSLGACCGYIIAGFDHSVSADLTIWSNAFNTSNEPGVVWVMQDVNGNGRPDDEWYQLKGSDYSNPLTIHSYIVTYYKPAGAGMDVEWTDNQGQRGVIDYLRSHHGQDSYYPAWIEQTTLTLRGTRLPNNGVYNSVTGQWASNPLGWGYADNCGSDQLTPGTTGGGAGQCVNLKISNAVMANGEPIALEYVDFVMVQSGLMQQLGQLGESSTEVCAIADFSLVNN
ncbi:MAG: PKD domain-containing protein [Firmicutes bacterium]|nr:PKD domain-containing protein [Bacillota bacterium]MCM1401256.1 PKD domain-containing protein [Bacteroides sp.]MCM1477195.1 PKD domain-containing protein [Bacteroides sp.]